MKTLTIPVPLKCSKTLAPAGEISLATFIRELVFVRPGWRDRGKGSLLLEIDAQLEANPGETVKWSDEAHEQLCIEAAMKEVQLRWELAPIIAQFQELLHAAKSSTENGQSYARPSQEAAPSHG